MRISEKIMRGKEVVGWQGPEILNPCHVFGYSTKVIVDYFFNESVGMPLDGSYKNITLPDQVTIFDASAAEDNWQVAAEITETKSDRYASLSKYLNQPNKRSDITSIKIEEAGQIMSVGGDASIIRMSIYISRHDVSGASYVASMIFPVIESVSCLNWGALFDGKDLITQKSGFCSENINILMRMKCAVFSALQTVGEYGRVDSSNLSMGHTTRRKHKKISKSLADYEYKTITVGYKKASTGTNYRIDLNDPESTRRKHFCRGHYATYTKNKPLFGKYVGTFYKSPHVRGNAEVGTIVKDYKAQV